MQGVEHTTRRLIEESLSSVVSCTRSSCVANLLYEFELIILNNAYSAQYRVLHIRSDGRLRHH